MNATITHLRRPLRIRRPQCPPWCNRNHPAYLSPDSSPSHDVADFIYHTTQLATAPGLRITYSTPEDFDPTEAGELEGPCFVTLTEPHGANATRPATSTELRTWARELIRAANAADRLHEQD